MIVHIFITSIWRVINGERRSNRFAKAMDVDALIGWNFKRVRTASGLSQEEIALRLGTIDQGYISQLEAGERNPTGRTLYKLAQALDVPVGDLFLIEDLPEHISTAAGSAVKKSRAGRAAKQTG